MRRLKNIGNFLMMSGFYTILVGFMTAGVMVLTGDGYDAVPKYFSMTMGIGCVSCIVGFFISFLIELYNIGKD